MAKYGYEIGKAFIQVVPSFEDLETHLRQGARKMTEGLDKEISKALPESFEKGVEEANKRARKASRRGGKESGEEFAGHFADTLGRRLDAVLRAVPKFKIDADSSPAERRVADLRTAVAGLRGQQIGVDISDKDALDRARKLRDEINVLLRETTADDFRLPVDLSQARDEFDAWIRVVEAGGEKAARELERHLEQAALDVQRQLDEYTRGAEQANRQIVKDELRRVDDIERAREAAHKEEYFRQRKAREDEAEAVRKQFDEYTRGAERANQQIARDAERRFNEAAAAAEKAFSKTWAGRVRENIDNALAALPDIGKPGNFDERRVKDLRGELQALRDQRIGIDISEKEARRKIAQLKADLTDLARNSETVEIHADATAAAAEIATIERMLERLNGRDVRVKVHADGKDLDDLNRAAQVSLSRLESLIALSVSLGTALVPSAAAAAAAIGFIGTAAASSVAGLGVMVLGFGGVGEAVKALEKNADEAEKKTSSLARSGLQVAGAADAIASAERSLANVRANNAEAQRRAVLAVQDAERQVARAQEDARRATLDLVRAREEERRANQDLTFDLEELGIAQRQAALDQIEAKKDLDKVLANPRATQEQREQAQITYDQITLRIRELGVRQERLTEQQQKATRLGIEGSDRVQAAHERVRNAAEAVEAAERRRGEALHAQQVQQRQAAFALAQAQQSLANAHRQAEQAAVRQSVAGGDAADNLREAMDELSPTGRRFARFLFGLKDELLSLRAAASDPMLPGVQRSIEDLLPFLPDFRNWVGRVAGTVGDLFEETSNLLTTDRTWRRFWAHMDTEMVPTLERLWRIGRNVTTGLLGLYLAFTPFNDDIGGGLEEFTERFARWSAELENSVGFQQFLAYVRDNGPRVVHLIGELATFVGHFVQAAAPTGALVVQAFTALLEALNAIPMPVLTALVGLMSLYSAGLLVTNTASRLLAIQESIRNRTTAAMTNTKRAAIVTTNTYTASLAAARVQSAGMSTAMVHMNASARTAGRGLMGVVNLLGGPWQVALTVAALAVGYAVVKYGEQKQKVDDLKTALGLLGDAYRENGSLTSQNVRDVITQNEVLTDLINSTNEYGISVEAVARAASGEKDAHDEVIAALRAKREAYLEEIQVQKDLDPWRSFRPRWGDWSMPEEAAELQKQADSIERTIEAMEKQRAQAEKNRQAQLSLDSAQRQSAGGAYVLASSQKTVSEIMAANKERIKELEWVLVGLSDAQATGKQRADAMRQAIEWQTGATTSLNEQNELLSQRLLDLKSSVQANGRSLSLNTQEGLRNRDALQAAAAAIRDMYLADIEAEKPIEEVTKAHQARIDKLIQEADKLGLNEAQTRKLITAYGDVPENIETIHKTQGFEKAYKELQELQFMQYALGQGMTPEAAWTAWQEMQTQHRRQRRKTGNQEFSDGYGVPVGIPGFRAGGLFRGRGTGVSDSNLAWLSNGEFIQPTASVDYYGRGLMEGLRTRSIPREALPGFADGGLVVPMRVSLAGMYMPTLDEALAKVVPTASPGGIGSADMMRILRAQFPGLPLYSGFRPGSRTASGNLSYHAMTAKDGDKGRAVDVPPRRDVFEFIHNRYFAGTRELIWAGDPNRNIHNGRHHRYSPSILANHGVAGQPNAHIHWAYDAGGYLPPGLSTVWNGTGRPEPVLTEPQWRQVAELVRERDSGPREVHNWHFREAALDHGRLQAWADRRDAMARPGRRR